MRKRKGWIAWIFLLPYLILFGVFRLIPSVAGIGISLFKWDLASKPIFTGFANFVRLFHDTYFKQSIINTLLFFLLTVPLLIVLALFLAVLLNKKLRGSHFVRMLVIIPYVLIPAVVGIMWNWIYDNNFGLLNYYLKRGGTQAVNWLTDERWALFSVALVVIWSFLGYNLVLFLAGLQGISRELYEAACIDGAGKMQCFFKITLPQLRPVTSMVITLSLVNVVQLFDQIYVMTNGGPGTATLTMVQYMYTAAFKNYELGYGAAIEVIILVLLALLLLAQNKLIRAE